MNEYNVDLVGQPGIQLGIYQQRPLVHDPEALPAFR
jgi:hypothetical protein